MEYYSLLQGNELKPLKAWKNLKNILLTERSPSEKVKNGIIQILEEAKTT